MVDKTTKEAIQKRDIIVTQIINELGITIETNAKPLIRCKECKHWKENTVFNGKLCLMNEAVTKGSDFCSYGEGEGER